MGKGVGGWVPGFRREEEKGWGRGGTIIYHDPIWGQDGLRSKMGGKYFICLQVSSKDLNASSQLNSLAAAGLLALCW
jgi:hypothetical protein